MCVENSSCKYSTLYIQDCEYEVNEYSILRTTSRASYLQENCSDYDFCIEVWKQYLSCEYFVKKACPM